MRYCPKCFDEYRDEVARCAKCDEALVTPEELERLPEFRRTQGISTGRFVRITTTEDPFDSEALCDALESAGIPVLARARRGSTVDPITTGTTHGWWEILVPEDQVERATPVVLKRREELKAAEADAGDAAEAEEAESEASSSGPDTR